ncbi:hypothetical protein [Kribbella sp. CA-247076]|uniref:hypothetical protein n=1 Tax=Kribbella sp. CA-247076 TaxID=3239941 RepID=UPI003D8EC030
MLSPESDVRTVDRTWRVAAFVLIPLNIVLAIVEVLSYASAQEDCPYDEDGQCVRSLTDDLQTANVFMAVALFALVPAALLPLRPATTPWRILCVLVLALSFTVRLALLTS